MVVVDKVVAGVVGRVDVDHLYLAQVAFQQQFQHLQVVALDVQGLSVAFQFLLSSGQGRSVWRADLLASTIAAFLPTQVNS